MRLEPQYFQTSIGRKLITAVSGIIFVGFVFGHMVGNLQIFLGPEKLNAYAKFLKDLGGLLWVARGVLFVAFFAHVITTIQLKIQNAKARPDSYAHEKTVQASIASRYMMLAGSVIFAFIIYHLLHFTLGITNPEYLELRDSAGRHDVYNMVVDGFKVPAVAIAYIFANALLGLHLSHGVASVFQTLGLASPKHHKGIKLFGIFYGLLIFLGNASIPIAIVTGFINNQTLN